MMQIVSADGYYDRPEVSNSDLTALRNTLRPRPMPDPTRAFRYGSLVDAMLTETDRLDYVRRTLDGEPYSDSEWRNARRCINALRAESASDPFLAHVLAHAATQVCMVDHGHVFDYCGIPFSLDIRCKWDWWLGDFGGDLKTTAAATYEEFLECVRLFAWDRSRAWYMDIAGSDRDFIYAISKRNYRIFRLTIRRGDEIYERGRERYEELAFNYWALSHFTPNAI